MDFKNVPKSYRPVPFWSWNEKLQPAETERQIGMMEKQGIGGFFMHARGGLQTEYMGEEWFENVEKSIEVCGKNGMHAWAYDENGWPSGFGGGVVNGLGEAYQQKYLRMEKLTENDTARENTIATVGAYRFYYEINPFYVDTLDGKVVAAFIDAIYRRYDERFHGRIDGFFTDEPQISRNGIPWSLILPDEYKNAYGDDLAPHLPELFLDVGEYRTTRVRFWRLITELFSKNFMKQIYDWCLAHGFRFTGHLVSEESLLSQLVTNGACMPHYEYMSIPGMDWLGRHNHPSLTPYQVASASRQLGKKQVLSETFAMCGHNVGHDELKWIYEYQMVRGINLLCQHLEGYSNRGIRKRDYPPAMYIQQPWWNDYRSFNDAMSRIGMLLSEGEDTVDVLVLHPQTTAWMLYNEEPDHSGEKAIMALDRELLALIHTLERKHIGFHLGDETLMERHGAVEGKCLRIGKKRYSRVIVPRHEVLFENTEKLLSQFVENGGVITTSDEIPANDIIDVPEITYCERKFDTFRLHYFVNSTENTFCAHIAKGSKVLDPVTGECAEFDGTYVFRRYASIVVIDDGTPRKVHPAKAPNDGAPRALPLSGQWEIVSCTENAYTLDYCDTYFDGQLIMENGYILDAMYRAIALKKPVHLRCVFHVAADYIPENLSLVCETPEIFRITINGTEIDKTDCGCFVDRSFRRIAAAKYLRRGENTIELETDFRQSETVYRNLEKSYLFESEKNKLTFDMEIEQIYLVGDFSLRTPGSYCDLPRNAVRYAGQFIMDRPCKTVFLDRLNRQGFPFFAGTLTVKKTFLPSDGTVLDFVKTGINVVKAAVDGKELPAFLWEPYTADLAPYLSDREKPFTLSLTLTNNLRNLQGPFHLSEGECYAVHPASFYHEDCVWYRKRPGEENRWDDNYCFADVSLKNRDEEEKTK